MVPDTNEIECPNCGTVVYYEVTVCPKCGLHFYALDEQEPPEPPAQGLLRDYSISAVIAGWLVSAAINFALNLLASQLWPGQNPPLAGQALMLVAPPVGGLAGGYLAARIAGDHPLRHGLSVSILSLLTAFLLEAYWQDLSAGLPGPRFFAGLALLLAAGPLGAWLWLRLNLAVRWPVRPKRNEAELYRELLQRVRFDTGTVERLIDYERRRHPSASRRELLDFAHGPLAARQPLTASARLWQTVPSSDTIGG